MRTVTEQDLSAFYNLLLEPGTRDWERQQLLKAKEQLAAGKASTTVFAELEHSLRPLAVRNNLTPAVTDFYQSIMSDGEQSQQYDYDRHQAALTDSRYDHAIFAGGCFWCMVEPFELRPGVISVLSGYTGGHVDSPTYDQVTSQATGHVEAVEIVFDPNKMSYAELLKLYWQIIDPTDDGGQINDRGDSYRPIIFVHNKQQCDLAEASKRDVAESGRYSKPIVVAIRDAQPFWPAENYHQEFYKKQPKRYRAMERSRRQFLWFQKVKAKLTRRIK
ncbi:peptide-methionine (S)-S-oxide reductase MsrA [Furfurilactobacillus rossiae]|uniref:peptide-methionine (S)-S-oxide reductase MsrA n=1 Tax=Furfurilactobacillus rossiae TaxID=231049 RepID=UPI001F3C66DA|nr:peptide-methionine (S)-S-oxide reductase MsrA [Furfurilactobacillus rossiae]MCF6165573.1 peptide-methionine (S)-S-oxide reductase MsrA [Furfurilactobacillus rossiae]